MSAKGKDREGFVIGGVGGPFDDGYTKNVQTHNHGILNTAGDLLGMDSYQSRFRLFLNFCNLTNLKLLQNHSHY